MRPPPTDFELLRAIYEQHHDDYVERSRAEEGMVALDIDAVAARLDCAPVSVRGRLYYHLDPIYAQEPTSPSGRRKPFYLKPRNENESPSINFPLLEAVLAGAWQQRNVERRTFWLAVISLIVAVGSLAVAVLT